MNWAKDAASGAVSAVGDTAKKGLSYIGLAEGGVVTQPTTANIAEKGKPEAVIPLDKLQGVLSQVHNQQKMGLPPMTQGAMSYSAGGSDSLVTEIKQLNKSMGNMVDMMKMMAYSAESNVRATKSLSRDIFKF
jgi:SLT domain-containing protein